MNKNSLSSLAEIENSLNELGNEARKKYPEVTFSTERALMALKTIREMYVADVMRSNKTGSKQSIQISSSSDIASPYILMMNYIDASSKLISMAFNGIQMLINYDVVPPADVKNILRVLSIQAGSGKNDLQLKLLQILLHLATSLSKNPSSSQYFTEATVCSFLTLALQLCDVRSAVTVAVSSTALATARQVLAIVMDGAKEVFFGEDHPSKIIASHFSGNFSGNFSSPPDLVMMSVQQAQSSFATSALLLIRDLGSFMQTQGGSGEWLRGISIPQQFALDLMHDVLSGWKILFQLVTPFRALLKDVVCPALKPLLQQLQADFMDVTLKSGISNSAAFTSRVVRISRCILLDFIGPELADECSLIVTLLSHSLQPERSIDGSGKYSSAKTINSVNFAAAGSEGIFKDASTIIMSRFSILPSSKPPQPPPSTKSGPNHSSKIIGSGMLSLSDQGHSTDRVSFDLPAHPAGVCLETLLAYFLSDVPNNLMTSELGCKVLSSAMAMTNMSTCSILIGGLSIESNVRDFEIAAKSSQLVTLLEGVLTGAETDVTYVMRSVHDHLLANSPTSPSEVLILAVQLLQVVTRLLVKTSLQIYMWDETVAASTSTSILSSPALKLDKIAFLPSSLMKASCPPDISSELHTAKRLTMVQVCESSFDIVQDACSNVLRNVDYPSVVRRCLGMLSELALSAGLLRLIRPCEIIISSLSRQCVPKWHGHEQVSADTFGTLSVDVIRWRHVQACVRLVQVIHVLAEIISDWDVICDAFEQLVKYAILSSSASALSPRKRNTASNDDVTPLEVDKIFYAIDRFKLYTVFMSDDALVRLMTSLVALSMNNLAVNVRRGSLKNYGSSNNENNSGTSSSNNASGTTGNISASGSNSSGGTFSSRILGPTYMTQGILEGFISFSLQAAVEVARNNSHRASLIWQMVISHLRTAASLNCPQIRALSVAATQDLIVTSLEHIQLLPAASEAELFVKVTAAVQWTDDSDSISPLQQHHHQLSLTTWNTISLSDEVVYNWIMPAFESSFSPRDIHRTLLQHRLSVLGSSLSDDLRLSQSDILSALNALSSVRYDDVRSDIIQALYRMLQGGGEIITFGWMPVIELLSSVPASMMGVSHPNHSVEVGVGDDDGSLDEENNSARRSWPRSSLNHAFNTMKLIVDDFIDTMSLDVIQSVIMCLYYFAAQIHDVNISLTSVEMLWKVGDVSLQKQPHIDTRLNESHGKGEGEKLSVLEIMMRRLLILSTDARPEIRNCGMNTLFSAMTANATLLTGEQWKQGFDEVIFPLFTRTESRSNRAMKNNEEVASVELKKGVMMAVHHSRDTAHKQWSETRSLALRGLSRVVKTCAKLLLREPWFKDTWIHSIDVCKGAIQNATIDEEVANAAVDVLFSMMKVASITSNVIGKHASGISKPNAATSSSSSVQGFRNVGGSDVDKDSPLKPSTSSNELATAQLWNLAWQAVMDIAKFDCTGFELPLHICQQCLSLYSTGLDGEFRHSVNLRGLLDMIVVIARPRFIGVAESLSSATRLSIAEVRLYQNVIATLKMIKVNDVISAGLLASALAEIAFSSQYVQINSFFDETVIVLSPCPDKLRCEAAQYLLQLLKNDEQKDNANTHNASISSSASPTFTHGIGRVTLDVIFHRYFGDICQAPIAHRDKISGNTKQLAGKLKENKKHISSSQKRESSSNGVSDFFSSIGWGTGGRSPDHSKPYTTHTHSSSSLLSGQLLGSLHRLDHYDPNPVIEKKENVEEENYMWTTFVPQEQELDVLLAVLASLSQDSGSGNGNSNSNNDVSLQMHNSITQETWSNIVGTVLCSISPWMNQELPKERRSATSSPQAQQSVKDLLQRVLQESMLCRIPASWTIGLLEAVEIAAKLILHSLRASFSSLAPSPSILPLSSTSSQCVYLATFYSGVLHQIMICLRALVLVERNDSTTSLHFPLSRSVRTKALSVLLTLANDICIVTQLERDETIASVFPSSMHEVCAQYLLTLTEMDTTFVMLPTPLFSSLPSSELNLLQFWLECCSRQFVNEIDDNSRDNSLIIDSTDNDRTEKTEWHAVNASLRKKSHLLALLPLAVKLTYTARSPDVRDAAMKAVTSLDMAALSSNYVALLSRCDSLEIENKRLESELYRVKSAATLPF